jgi:mannose/cellobiose epimerase-like protein (N-acyl-D-glucosamine 2-epimerase family)
MGWQGDADGILKHCFDTLTTTGWHADGGWIHLFNPDGTVRDETRDTYDHCFVLFGLAWLYQGDRMRRKRASGPTGRSTIWTAISPTMPMAASTRPIDRKLPRRANPHMHFLEAMLAWYEATGEEKYLDRAQAMVMLFDRHFFDESDGHAVGVLQGRLVGQPQLAESKPASSPVITTNGPGF